MRKGNPVKKTLFSVIIITLAVAIGLSAEAIPRVIAYQGKVTDIGGVGVNDTLPIQFGLYEVETGGVAVWTETHPSIPIVRGLFDVDLGSVTPLNLEFDVLYYLEVTIDGHVLEPRVTFRASPYSFRSIYADTALYAIYADSSAGGGGGFMQDDVDVPLTSPGDFGIVFGETEVHGALVDLDQGVRANLINISANETAITSHVDADHDLSSLNECITWFEFDDVTDSLWIFDGAYPVAAYIPNGPFGFDTLYTTDSLTGDTMLVMSNFRVYGMLFADSIAAMDDFVEIFDSLIVHGSQWIDGDLHIGGNLYFGDSLIVNSLGVDTIWSEGHDVTDTIVLMANTKIHGELIADSIQADADTIWLDDNTYTDGSAIVVDSVGIGTETPTARLHVEGEPDTWGEAVAYFQNNYVGSADGAGIYAVSVPQDYWGIGVVGEGGYIGVEGDVYPTGSDYYYGVYGYVYGSDGENYGVTGSTYGDGINYGLYGYASDNGSGASENYGSYLLATNGAENYGVYAWASGGSVNWAGYFDAGDVNIENDIYLNTGLYDGVSFGAHDQYLRSDGSDVFWDFLYGDLIRVDTLRTLSASDSDTIWTMAQFYVNGELIADSMQAVGDTIHFDDNIIVHGSNVVDDDLLVYDDAMIGESLMVGMDAYVMQTLTVGTDLYVMHNAWVNDTIFANVITADSITTNYLLSTDIDVTESLFVDGPANFDSTVTIDDDTLYVDGPAQFDSMVVITPGHQLWVDKIYGTVAGTLFVDTVLATPEVALDSIEAWNGNSIIIKDSTYFRRYVNVQEDLEVDGDGLFNQDVWIGDSLMVVGNTYLQSELEVDLDAYFHDNLTNDDSIFANVITADSITTNYLLATDVDVMESLFVDGPANFDSTVYIDDDTLYVEGPAQFDSMVVITPGHQLWVDKIYGTVAGTLFVDTVLATPEVALDSLEAWNTTSLIIKDTTYFRRYVNVQEDLEVDGDGLFNQDVWIGDSLMVVGNTYLQSELEVDLDAYFHDNLTNDDTIFANVITADSITANYLLATDVDVLESLYVDGPANFDSTVYIDDDTLYVEGPAMFDSMVVITPGHQLWVDKIYGTVAGTLFVDTVLATPEVALDSLEAWNGNSIIVKDSTYFQRYVNVQEDLEVDGDGLFNQDVEITDSLIVGGNTYLQGELEVDLDAYFHDNLTNDDTIFANVITADSITAFYLLATDVDVLESLFVAGPTNLDSTVFIGDDTLYVDGPAMFDSSVVITPGHELWVDRIYGTVAGSLFVDTVLVTPEIALDSIEAWNSGTILIKDSVLINAGLTVDGDVFVDNGNRYYGVDATGADSFWIYDDGDTTRFDADNPIKIGDASLVVETDGDVIATQDFYVLGDAFFADNVVIAESLDVTMDVSIGGDLDVTGDISADDMYLADSLIIMGSAYIDDNLEIDHDLWVNDDAYIDDSLTVNGDAYFDNDVVIDDDLSVNDSLILYGDAIFQNDLQVGDSLFVNEYLRVQGDVWIGDNLDIMDSLMIWGPIIIAGHQPLWADTLYTSRIHGTKAGSLFVDTVLVVPEIALDSIEAWNSGTVLLKDSLLINSGLMVTGDAYLDGGIHDGTDFGTSGQILMTDGSDIYWSDVVASLGYFDTLRSVNGLDSDTIWTMAQLYVNGELIADSIQADGDTIWFDDNTYTRGSAIIADSVGIGTETPTARLHVEGEPDAWGEAVGYFQNNYVGTTDGAAVYGVSVPADYYGIGVYGLGGYIGTTGEVYTTGSNSYYGVYGYVDGSDGSNYGVYGDAWGDGENYGIYGYAQDNGSGTSINYGAYMEALNGDENYGIYATASGGTINWAAYFADGDVNIDNDLYLDGGIHDGTSFGTAGQILITDGSDVYWSDLTASLASVDTIRSVSGSDSDTIWTMAQLYVNGELIVDSIQAIGDTVYIDNNLFVDGAIQTVGDVVMGDGAYLRGSDASGANDFWIYDDGDTVRFDGDNPIKIGDASLIVETDGDVYVSGDLDVSGVLTGDGSGLTSIDPNSHWHNFLNASDGDPDSALYVDAAGNVGIGTTTPGNLLDVNGDASLLGLNTNFFPNDGFGKLSIKRPAWYECTIESDAHLVLTSGGGSDIKFTTTTSGEAMRVLSSGDVGIGTTSPQSKLHIDGGNVFLDNGNRYIGVDATQADSFWIYDDGDTTRFNSDNPIKVGNASLIVETDGDVFATQDLAVGGGNLNLLGSTDIKGSDGNGGWGSSISLNAGHASAGHGGGSVSIVGGDAYSISLDGGNVNLIGGGHQNAARPGDVRIYTGDPAVLKMNFDGTSGNIYTYDDFMIDGGYRYWGTDASLADSFWIYDDGDTTRFNSDNPIKIGDASLVVGTGGDVTISEGLNVGGAVSMPIVSVPANTDYTVTDNDYSIFVDTGFDAVNTVLTLPDATTCAGRIYVIKKTAGGGGGFDEIDIITSGTQTLDGIDDPIGVIASVNHAITIQSDGANWWVISEKKTP